jgi:hypothetical protein
MIDVISLKMINLIPSVFYALALFFTIARGQTAVTRRIFFEEMWSYHAIPSLSLDIHDLS